ncbi:MAG: DNA protecting protein DprA [Thermotoga sp. 50_1627]|uniref:DNA-processing protein DprA n=1 Tax=Pseudothermotoga sp. TaxID=2033661 RepID=UPI00076CC0DF|nr:MAG: DNA protecting protein DprA [Thermotoga sp. 50_64]KUK24852.1 MAG: DNA protecting protein DprA [Thermotoga sp. 50_1627]MBC7116918.1 DNA-protecting protein DprA [Pseudothermotoga sp.]MDK2923773.1 processing protein [Pseudothermotoga sp.]HBT39751.1 DNA-protecting protein DprA [Pseudothermotoga sp.]
MQPVEVFALWKFGRYDLETLKNLSEAFDSLEEARKAKPFQLERTDFDAVQKFANRQRELAEKVKAKIISFWDEAYPPLLRESSSPPVVLFCLGDEKLLKKECVSIVGTRRMTSYGKKVSHEMAFAAAQAGLVVVSGLAFGIDSCAHGAALEACGKTVAVLGTGVDVPYPSSNRKLYERIVQEGCVVSEFPLETKALKQNFPMRNRIVAGLSRATVVIEAPKDSGALITAGFAADMGRDVFAVPADIDKASSEGCNWLLRMGAIPLTHPSELLEYYGLSGESSQERDEILKLFSNGPLMFDEIVSVLKMDPANVLVKLTEYELAGKLVKLEDGRYHILGR